MRLFLSTMYTFPSQGKVFNDIDFSLLLYGKNSFAVHNIQSDSDVVASYSVSLDSNSALASNNTL
jgi:hypothetical protein